MSSFLTRILVATDGSEDSALAIRAAVDLSSRSGSELHVVHAWRRPMVVDYFLAHVAERSYAYECEDAKRLLEDQTEKIKAPGGPSRSRTSEKAAPPKRSSGSPRS